MGRLQPTVVVPPNSVRRSERARKAKETINKTIPDLLKSSPRARQGIHNAILMTDPQPPQKVNDSAASFSGSKLHIRIRDTDTLTAARQLTQSSRRASAVGDFTASGIKASRALLPNVCILNMASPLRPGGGFLEGATSQEEFLCMRTTLYASLWDDFYRLPEIGGVMTPDVLVHRDSTPDATELPKRERFFVDVISAGMLRFPETNTAARNAENQEGEIPCSCGVSYCDRDRELVTHKMRAVLRMAQSQGAEKVVLGAWGCGAYGNPVREVAKIWKRVLLGTIRKTENWTGIKEIVFAIDDKNMLKEFERCFADVISIETLSPPPEQSPDLTPIAEGAKSPTTDLVNELLLKIQETERQLDQISNPRSKARLRDVLAGLNKRLAAAGSTDSQEDEMPPDPLGEGEGEHESEVGGTGPLLTSSDGEENSYYNFDSSDDFFSGSVSPSASDAYEFKIPGLQQSGTDDDTISTQSSFEDHGKFDNESGWFSGSINGLSALLSKPRRIEASPELRPQSSGLDEVSGMNLSEYLRRYSEHEED